MDEKRISEERNWSTVNGRTESLQTRWVKHHIHRITDSSKRNVWKKEWRYRHTVSECNELVQNEYKKLTHDKIIALLHWHWCKTYWFKMHEKSYEHFVESLFVSLCCCCYFFFLFKYQLCKGALSILTLSLGVIIPHVTPVLYGNWVCSLNFQA